MTAKAEALASLIDVPFETYVFQIAPASEWDLDVLENFEDGKMTATIRALLGPKGWAEFRSTPRKVADLERLMEAVQKALGSGN